MELVGPDPKDSTGISRACEAVMSVPLFWVILGVGLNAIFPCRKGVRQG